MTPLERRLGQVILSFSEDIQITIPPAAVILRLACMDHIIAPKSGPLGDSETISLQNRLPEGCL